jgi:cyclomaltodextrinase
MLIRQLIQTAFKVVALCAAAVVEISVICDTANASSATPLSSAVIYNVYTSIDSPAGNLDGVATQLPRLKTLGVTILWLMPITPIGEPIAGHGAFDSPYCVHDYYAVNPAYGTSADFKKFVEIAHRLKMKVILDEVLNHTSWDNALINQHPEFYVHSDTNVNNPSTISQAFNYSDVAQLNYQNHDLWRYMDSMLHYWMVKYGVDGFRFDSADNPGGQNRRIPAAFWIQLGSKIRQLNPNVIMLGECETPDLARNPFNIDYGWDVYYGYKDAINGAGAQNIVNKFNRQTERIPDPMLHMTIQDDWDMACDQVVFGGADGVKAAATFNFTINGVPMIYNGMEIGNYYPENTNTHSKIDWSHPNPIFAGFYQALITLRRNNPALQQGKLTWLTNSTPSQALTYTRTGNGETFLAVINITNTPIIGVISGLDSHANYHVVWPTPDSAVDTNGKVEKYNLAPHGFVVYKRNGG